MAYLTKQQFAEWAKNVWSTNDRTLIKSMNYCMGKCQCRSRLDKNPKNCAHFQNSNYCDFTEYVVCSFYVNNSNYSLNVRELQKRRKEFLRSFVSNATQKDNTIEIPKVPITIQKQYRSPQMQKYIEDNNPVINLSNNTAIDIESQKGTFINGRFVYFDDLQNENS